MQVSSQKNELLEFKNEILGEIRLIEKKFVSEFNTKFTEINSTFKEMDLRLDTISQNNNSLLDLISKKNMNFDKLEELDIFKNKTEETLITQKIEFENIFQEIEQLNKKYEKIVKENLIVTGYIGLGYKYKNLGEYLIYNMNEIDKLRYDTQQNKIKVVNWEKTAKEIISSSLLRFETYTDNKYKRINAIFEQKLNKLNKKMIDLETEINKYQYEINILMNSMKNDKQKILKDKNNNIESFEKKLEELNKKLNLLIPNRDSFNKNRFRSPEKRKNNNKDTLLLLSENNQMYKSNKNIQRINKKKADSNLMNQLNGRNQKNVVHFKDEQNYSSNIFNDNNDFSQIFSDFESPKKKDSFAQVNINNENYINLESSPISIIKKINVKGRNNNNEQKLIVKTNFENLKQNEIGKDFQLNKTKSLANFKKYEVQEEKNPQNINKFKIINKSPQRKQKKTITKNIDDNNLIITDGKSHIDIKNIINAKTHRVQINRRNKTIDENPLTNNEKDRRLTINKNKEIIRNIHPYNLKKNILHNIIPTKDKIFISSNNSYENETLDNKNINIKENINEDHIKENINLKSLITPKSNLNIYQQRNNTPFKNIKLKKDLQLNVNLDRPSITTKIREYYRNKRDQMDHKINRRIVDCNLINLHLKNLTQKNFFYSPKSRNMDKVSNFWKTNNKFFSKRERYTYAKSVNNSDNKNYV